MAATSPTAAAKKGGGGATTGGGGSTNKRPPARTTAAKKKAQQRGPTSTAAGTPAAAPKGGGGKDESLFQKEARKARELLETASSILREVDDSPFVRLGEKRSYPVFEEREVVVGPLLGVGGFCGVYQVDGFDLLLAVEPSDGTAAAEAIEVTTSAGASTTAAAAAPASTATATAAVANGDEDTKDGNANSVSFDLERGRGGGADEAEADRDLEAGGGLLPKQAGIDERKDEEHYELGVARKHMQQHVRRNGRDARYAIKRLHSDLSVLERARGVIDLAIEAKLLSVLWHPNIGTFRDDVDRVFL